ncbi:MAG: 50S ribosomal protein L29 [Rhodothermales bacterium]
MKAKEVRDLSVEEIESRIAEENEQLHQLSFQHAIAQLENPMILRQKRRLIARLNTILNEKQVEQA